MPVSKVSIEWDQSKAMAAAQKITDAATKNTATRLQRRVERYVPVDTGRLKASIRQYKSKFLRGGYAIFAGGGAGVAMSPADTGRIASASAEAKKWGLKGKKARWTRQLSGGTYYGLFVEYGTGDRVTNGGRYTGRMKARKFMRRAINEEKNAFFAQLKKDFT